MTIKASITTHLLLFRLVVVMASMVGAVLWIPLWIFYGVVLADIVDPRIAILSFFVPVGATLIMLGE